MSNSQMVHNQTLLLNPDQIHPVALNPAIFLPDSKIPPNPHDCRDILAEVHGWRKDLTDVPLPDTEVTWDTDGGW